MYISVTLQLVSYFPDDKVISGVFALHSAAFAVESVVAVEECIVGFAVKCDGFH